MLAYRHPDTWRFEVANEVLSLVVSNPLTPYPHVPVRVCG